ncbi:hypothetical protein CCP2SC5_600023 [Azospirillaceae bacterium]
MEQTGPDFERHVAEVNGVLSSLADIVRRVDSEFVRIGDDLQSILDRVDSIQIEIQQAVSTISGRKDATFSDGILNHLQEYAQDAEKRFSEGSKTLRGCLENMSDNVQKLEKLSWNNDKFIQNNTRMNTISIYFSIEITRSPTAMQIFSGYANDIRALFGDILASVNKIGKEIKGNICQQQVAVENVNKNYVTISTRSQEALRESYSIVSHISQISVETLERVTKYFSLLGRSIAHIMTAIQVGDITRQQIEHIVEALNSCMKSPVSNQKSKIEWARIIILQHAQLNHVHSEISDAYATIRESLDMIAASFGILATDVDDLLSGARSSSNSSNWFAQLTGEMKNMSNLEKESITIVNRTLEALNEAFSSSKTLQSYVDKIAVNNRRLSLEAYNARILSMRLGNEGRALTTLAKEVSDLSRITSDYMLGVTDAINQIVASAESAEADIDRMHADMTEAKANSIDVAQLEREIGQFVSLTTEACKKAQTFQDDVQKLENSLKAIDVVGQNLDHTITKLGNVVAAMTKAYGDSLGGELQIDRQHAERYTMKTERLIHHQLTNPKSVVKVGIDSSMAQRRDMIVNEDKFGENVDLF